MKLLISRGTRSFRRCFFWFSLVLVSACNETKDLGPETLGVDFYPINIGQYRIYEVEEIQFKIVGFDTLNYQLRETIFDSIQSIDQTTYLLRRDVRQNSLQEWESDSIWAVASTDTYIAVSENNIPFIKLTFPVIDGREWNGNSLNSRGNQIYYYQGVSQAIVDSVAAEDHVRVVIEDIEENITGLDLRSEVYVRGVGLVEKDYLTQRNCTASDCGDDLGKVIGGRSLKQTLIEIGTND